MSLKNLLGLLIISVFFVGCTFKAPEYKADIDTLDNLSDINLEKVNITEKSNVKLKNINSIPLRAVAMGSPYGNNFNDYLYESLSKQVNLSNFYDKESSLIIDSKLTKNEADIWGFGTGFYDLGANFTIKKNEQILLNKNYEIRHIFPSSFLGQIAIENAINNYPVAVKKLISKFLNDQEVINKLKKEEK